MSTTDYAPHVIPPRTDNRVLVRSMIGCQHTKCLGHVDVVRSRIMVESSSRNCTPESVLSIAFEIVFVGEKPRQCTSKTIYALIGFPSFQLRANPRANRRECLRPKLTEYESKRPGVLPMWPEFTPGTLPGGFPHITFLKGAIVHSY